MRGVREEANTWCWHFLESLGRRVGGSGRRHATLDQNLCRARHRQA